MKSTLQIVSYIHTYLIGHYKPSVRITTEPLTPHTRYLCLTILYMSVDDYSLKSTPNDRFFEKLFYENFIYFQNFNQKTAESKSPMKYFFIFRLVGDV